MGIELFKFVILILFILGSSGILIGLLIELILMIKDVNQEIKELEKKENGRKDYK